MTTNSRTPKPTVAECLETLEGHIFPKKSHTQAFQNLYLICKDEDSCKRITSKEVLKILAAFEKCLKVDIKCIPHAISAVLTLLTHAKVVSTIPTEDLLPSALAVLNILKVLNASETQHLKTLGVQVLLSYPVDVITMIVTNNCSEVLETIEGFIPHFQQGGNQLLPVFLKGLLTALPLEKKNQLIQDALPTWFKVIAVIMDAYSTDGNEVTTEGIECLEVLIAALVNVDYFQCPLWQNEILKYICDPKIYPATILKQLQKGTIWHRFWIAFVKLLKNQITRTCPFGTPIHPMLEVVETAFKMGPNNRCRAFQCWDVLIDNLSKDTNPKSVPRYIKLLLIPLKLNNAKTEDTARAKFYTWWNLIVKFQSRLDPFVDEVLFEFLNFMFGTKAYKKHTANQVFAGVGQTYDSLRSLCIQAYAEMVGHDANCKCTSLPKLKEKLLNNKLLASHWDKWMTSLKMAISMIKSGMLEEPMEVLCVWKAFVNSISNLPPNGVRKDMFNELIQVLIDLLKICSLSTILPDVLFSLALSLTEDNEKIRNLVISTGDEQPLHKIVLVVTNPKMIGVFERYEAAKMVELLKPFTDLVVTSSNTKCCLECLLHDSRSLKIWTALVHSINETPAKIDTDTVKRMLLWPIWAMEETDVDKCIVMEWQKLYNAYAEKLSNTDFDAFQLLEVDINNLSYFKFIATVCILKSRLYKADKDADEYPGLLENITAQVASDSERYKQAFPVLVDTVVILLEKVSSRTNVKLATMALNCARNMLRMLFCEIKSQNKKDDDTYSSITVMMESVFKTVQHIAELSQFSQIFCGFVKDLTDTAMSISKESYLYKYLQLKLSHMRLHCPNETKIEIDKCIGMLPENANKTEAQFTTPKVKTIKRSKKREPIIVNTSTENGEEYAVVKSNWKFNPKNLTENQKEKLQRKREDIPALYQDLSQSQEEFKLSKWQTDSQDTTTSSNSKSSKLTTKDDASNILKNIQSSDVVPNIIQNILSEKHTSGSSEINAVSVLHSDNKCDKVGRSSPAPKNTKSPRMALKDRVFRNVRNLIENSSCKNDTIPLIDVEYQLKTTPTKKTANNANLVNSAPPLTSTDRPSRVKRIPKKFADVQLFGLKKRRYSQADSQSHSENELEILNDLCQGDSNKNISKSELSVTSEIVVKDECIPENINATEDNKLKSCQDAVEVTDVSVLQIENIKDVPDNITTENICSTKDNEPTQEIEKNYFIVNIDNNNEQEDKHDKEDSREKIDYQEQQKNDVKCVPKEDDAQNIQNKQNKASSLNCQQNDEVQDIVMEDMVPDHLETLEHKVTDTTIAEVDCGTDYTNKQLVTLRTPDQKPKQESQKSTAKKSSSKKSRIEKQLNIDMVEGHPFLKIQSERRITRKKVMESEKNNKRSHLETLYKKRAQTKTSPKEGIKSKGKEITLCDSQDPSSVTIEETQEKNTLPENAPCSEDVIESSQDSNFTVVTVKSTKRTPKRQIRVTVEKLDVSDIKITGTQDLLQDSDCEMLCVTNKSNSQNDIELPQNKTAEVDKNQSELTENMDTEPLVSETTDVIIINDDRESPITVTSENIIGVETQELAEADTQPNDPADFVEYESNETSPVTVIPTTPMAMDITQSISPTKIATITASDSQDVIEILTKPDCGEKDSDICSPFKDDEQRKQDFLNNTSEISPIKVQSPDTDKTSPEKEEETSSDYLVVKLSSPVHSNGEPFISKGSPEFFTEDKQSPDKRDQSPPRIELAANTGSPSSSLSLKKNRTQNLRPGGRAAHMIGLCIPDAVNSKKSMEKVEPEESKKPNTSTPARRNLRVLYNNVNENTDISDDNEQDNFLKLKKALPSVDSSPAVPILKRKIDIVDDTITSPASKRKRVSFHDPPVSTTVSVQKYIKPDCIEPPSVAQRRLEVQITRLNTKSPKRTENTLKLDTVLSKAIESFSEPTLDSLPNDTTLDVTPAVEVVITSELNDTDPICPDLIDCKDSIENIAAELSSAAMKDLFIKELDEKVVTVGDLAKMTELEVNRLCIKAPKIQVARKVLTSYISNRNVTSEIVPPEPIILDETAIAKEMNEVMTVSKAVETAVETQTDSVSVCEAASQTGSEITKLASTQTTIVSTLDTDTQTLESGYKTTSQVISSCLAEREDFIQKLGEILPKDSIVDMLVNQAEDSTPKILVKKIWDRLNKDLSSGERTSREFSVIKDILLERYDMRDLLLFCSRLFQDLHDKTA